MYGSGYAAQGAGYGGYGAAPASGGYGGSYGGYDAGYDQRGAAGMGPGYGPGYGGAGMQGPAGYRGEPRAGPRPGFGGPAAGGALGGGGGFACVRLRGLPFGVTERDIVLFLGCEPVDILPVTRNSRPTGEAFVVLRSLPDMDMALRKNKAYMGTRYIEVFEARKLEYYRAVALAMGDGYDQPRERSRSRSPHRAFASTNVLKLRGLPFSATADDVVAFFDDPALGIPALASEQVTIAIAADGRPNGMAFVEFDAPESAEAAMKKDKQIMGSRYVEIFPSSTEERSRYK